MVLHSSLQFLLGRLSPTKDHRNLVKNGTKLINEAYFQFFLKLITALSLPSTFYTSANIWCMNFWIVDLITIRGCIYLKIYFLKCRLNRSAGLQKRILIELLFPKFENKIFMINIQHLIPSLYLSMIYSEKK